MEQRKQGGPTRRSIRWSGVRAGLGMCVLALAVLFLLRLSPAPSHFHGAVHAQGASHALDSTLPFSYIRLGWFDWAAEQLEANARNHPESVETLVILGMAYQQAGKPRDAVASYQRAVDLATEPDEVGAALALLGDAWIQLGNIPEAERRLEEAIALMPESAFAHEALGRARALDDRVDEAIASFLAAAEASPEWLAPVVRASELLNSLGDFPRSAQLLWDVRGLGVRDPHYHIAAAQASLGLRSLLSENPSDEALDALRHLGIDELDADEELLVLAERALDRASQLAPELVPAANAPAQLHPIQ